MELGAVTAEELAGWSPAGLQMRAHELEVLRRRAEAASADLMRRVDEAGAYKADGHRSVAAWGRATNNWSGGEAAAMAKLARAMRLLPRFAELALAGELGVQQMHAVARVVANPRVREHVAGADDLFCNAASELPFDDLMVVLRHWEELADADGARARHDRAMRDRRAALRFVGERSYLEAEGPAYDGVVCEEVLQHFIDLEWRTEWDLLAAIHGDAMHAGLMERTHAQRSFDALQRVFATAAGAKGDNGAGVAVTVDILIDQATFEHELEHWLDGEPEPIPPSHAPHRRCEDTKGRVVDPRAVVAAALVGQVRRVVLGAEGVALDMGRRRRLFTGALREAVLLSSRRCPYPGCMVPAKLCQADHLRPAGRGGHTSVKNGAPGCGHHNRWKNNGTITLRDAKGLWHTYRPDGTEIGWPVIRTNLKYLKNALDSLGP